MPIIIEDGVEKAVIFHTVEEKLEKKVLKEKLNNLEEIKKQINKKRDEEIAFIQPQIDEFKNLLNKFK